MAVPVPVLPKGGPLVPDGALAEPKDALRSVLVRERLEITGSGSGGGAALTFCGPLMAMS